jgi:hypothetical protein
MKKTNFTFVFRSCLRLCLPVLLLLAMFNSAQAQCELSCVGTQNFSIQTHPGAASPCQTEVGPNYVLVGQSLIDYLANTACTSNARLQTQINRNGVWTPALSYTGVTQAQIDVADVGQTLEIRVVRVGAGDLILNSCWGFITVEDKQKPVITACVPDASIYCAQIAANGVANTALTGRLVKFPATPRLIDGTFIDCSSATTSFTDFTVEHSCTSPFTTLPTLVELQQAGLLAGATPGDYLAFISGHTLPTTGDVTKVIIRKWLAVDAYTNISYPCYQFIYVKKVSNALVSGPPDVEYSCTAVPANFLPSTTGYPQVVIGGVSYSLDPTALQSCNIDGNYTDLRVDLCGPGGPAYKIVRDWTIIDWCASNIQDRIVHKIQLIKVLDITPAVVSASWTDYLVSGGSAANCATTSSTGNYDVPWTGSFVQGRLTRSGNTPDNIPGTTQEITALGHSNDCGGRVTLTFTASDPSCSQGAVSITSSDGTVLSSTFTTNAAGTRVYTYTYVGNFPTRGDYPVTFTAKDPCDYALAKQTYLIHVVDNIAPQPVCHGVTADLSNDGQVTINWASFDEGSHDNCGPVIVSIRRMNSCTGATLNDPYTANVTFGCCDAGATGLMVQLLVRDQAGNCNFCMAAVTIQNKIRPTCIAPGPRQIPCSDLANIGPNYNAYGTPTFWDNCGYTVSQDSTTSLDNCKIGTIVRNWTVTPNGRDATYITRCSQTITVVGKSDFTVDFPDDITVSCVGAIPSKSSLQTQMLDPNSWANSLDGAIKNDGCGVLGVQIVDDTITSDPNSCMKILRKITVIDWCKYNPNNNSVDQNRNCYGKPVNYDNHGYAPNGSRATNLATWQYLSPDYPQGFTPQDRRFRDADGLTSNISGFITSNGVNNPQDNPYSDGIMCFTQIIKVIDRTAPVFTPVSDLTVNDNGGNAIAGQLVCNGRFQNTLVATDLCAAGTPGSGIAYRWRLFRASDNAQISPIAGYNAGAAVDVNLDFGVQYIVRAEAEDRCGNVGYLQYRITLVDAKAPIIICHDVQPNLVYMAAINAGMVPVWATDILASPLSDNCTAAAYLNDKLVIRRVDDNTHGSHATYPIVGGSYDGKSVSFSCTDYRNAPNRTIDVELWTKDEQGNASFCTARVRIQDNNGICTAGVQAAVSGAIQTPETDFVQNVSVQAYNANTMLGQSNTSATGAYSIAGLTTGTNVQVRATRDDNPLNGVTTYDIALISKHIIGSELLATPYKLIAADVNKDGQITGVDMLQMRKLILHIIPAFPSNTSWRFVDRAYIFTDPTNAQAENFTEAVNLNALATATQANFIGVKIGDINASSIANLVSGAASLNHGKIASLVLTTDDVHLEAGQEYTVSFNAEEFNAQGYQFTTNFMKGSVEILDINKGFLPNMSDANFAKFNNSITTSWNGETSIKQGEVFSIKFRAIAAAQLSDILTIGSDITKAEAYNAGGELMNVQLRFNNGKVSGNEFALYQNMPNPMNSITTIAFNLPAESKATLTIYDVSGKVIKTVTANYNKGYNEVSLQKGDINASGVLYYRLDSDNNTATRKMIIIE